MERFEVGAWDEAGVRLVQVTGEFDTAAADRFRAASERDDAELVVIDLRHVTFLDSSGLGELIALQRRVDARGARLAILRPVGEADRLFQITGIDGHLPLYDPSVPVLAQFNFG